MLELTLRVATPEDAPAIAAIYAPYVHSSTASFESVPPTIEEMAGRMAKLAGVFPWLVCQGPGGAPLGYAYASRVGERAGYDWAAQLSVYVDQTHHHGGVGRVLYSALLPLLKAQGYRTAWGAVSSPNPASEHFHEAMGFVRQCCFDNIGYKFGKPLSVVHYLKVLAPPMENPPRPCRFDALDPKETAAYLAAALQPAGARPK